MIAGCDYSTNHADIVLLPWEGGAETARWWRIPLRENGVPSELAAFHAAASVARTLVPALPWDVIGAFYLEAPLLGANVQTTLKLARVQGAILACVPMRVAVGEIQPAEWKKGLGLTGQASKQAVRDAAVEMGFVAARPDEDVQDAFDAFGIAWAVRAELQKQVRDTEPALELPAF